MNESFPEDTNLRNNQHRSTFDVRSINSPDVKWLAMENFLLRDIPTKFVMADFQRNQNRRHVYKIVEAIVNNKFYDPIIRCVRLKNGKYEVIDGQHRLKALWILHQKYNIRQYTIIMQLFKNEDNREIFRRINAGKPLTVANHLKTYDTGKYAFFEDLRTCATHSVSKISNSYINLLNAINYVQTGKTRSLNAPMLEDSLDNIHADEIAHAYRIAVAQKKLFEITKTPRVFNLNITKVLLRIGMEKNYNLKDYENKLKNIINNEQVNQRIRERFSVVEEEFYDIVKDIN